jgi:hypothetical protein
MAIACKLLGKDKPAATTYAVLYTVPADTEAQLVIYVTNQTTTTETYRVALVLTGGNTNPPDADDFIAYNTNLPPGVADKFDGICLATGDMVVIYSTGGNISFVATGLEVT